jgi:hypothetical protein
VDSVVEWKDVCKINVAFFAFLMGFGNNNFVGEMSI